GSRRACRRRAAARQIEPGQGLRRKLAREKQVEEATKREDNPIQIKGSNVSGYQGRARPQDERNRIRAALGAGCGELPRMVLRQGMLPLFAGLAGGYLGSQGLDWHQSLRRALLRRDG